MLSRRTLALDIGTVRIGVAVSDPLGMFAQGIAVLAAASAWMEELDALVKTYDPETLLLGVPLRTNGARGPEAEKIEELGRVLGERYPSVRLFCTTNGSPPSWRRRRFLKGTFPGRTGRERWTRWLRR